MTKIQKQRQIGWLIVIILIILLGFLFLYNGKNTKYKSLPTTPETGSEIIAPGEVEVQGDAVKYHEESIGFYATPSVPGEYPGVIMVHEWWGLNDNIRSMAKTLASNGYRVLAVDLYAGTVAKNMQEAQKMVSEVNVSDNIENLKSAKKFLEANGSKKVAALGWCFGGGQVLQYSLVEKNLTATVIYYGQLSSDSARLKNIMWPVLGIFGDADSSIPISSVKAFEEALGKNKTINEIYIYPGVGHAFANPSGANYAPEETKDAWQKTLDFLNKYAK